MRWNRILLSCACAFAMGAPAFAAGACECVPGKATAESYNWNFRQEANQLMQGIQDDAAVASHHASTLESYADTPEMSWQTHDGQLQSLKTEINDMGRKLCRLEAIRSAVAPWQQRTIDQMSKDLVLMANSADDAILYVTTHQRYLWNPTYENYMDNLYNLSSSLRKTADHAVEYARVRAKDQQLNREMEMKSSS